MDNLFYCNINYISDADISAFLELLPQVFNTEVTRFKRTDDQKSRLLARLMLRDRLISSGYTDGINHIKRDSFHKPYVQGWNKFNISHSGQWVVLVDGPEQVGIDIEQVRKFDFREILHLFHPNEQHAITSSFNPNRMFYELWVKKEAFLKAIGTGINNEMQKIDCTKDSLIHNEQVWHFHPQMIDEQYLCYICSSEKENSPILYDFSINLTRFFDKADFS